MPPITEQASQCCASIREILSLVGDKWSVLIIVILSERSLRFNELRRKIDAISQRMLTRTLRELERNGLLTRTVTPSKPPSVAYELTALGKSLLEPVQALITWTLENYQKIAESRGEFDKTDD